MKNILTLLAGGAAAIGMASPAAAQYYPPTYPQPTYPQQTYPQQTYPQGYGYPQQGYGQQGGIAGIINQLLGNRYTAPDRTAVTQCATAAQAKATAQYRGYGVNRGYNQGYGQPYNQGYGQPYATPRVTGITNVERRGASGVRVTGVMSSGMATGYGQQGYYPGYGQGYGNQGYNPAYAAATNDLTFRCNVDYRGAVTNVRISRAPAYRR